MDKIKTPNSPLLCSFDIFGIEEYFIESFCKNTLFTYGGKYKYRNKIIKEENLIKKDLKCFLNMTCDYT